MLKKLLISLFAMILVIGGATMTMAKNNNWDKTFPKSDKVDVKKVSFKNRYGITLVGDLYTPKHKPSEKWQQLQLQGLSAQ